jgi:hypothetical protein
MKESTVSGHRAIRASASFMVGGEPGILEALYLVVGQTLWSVQAIGAQQYSGAALRIMDSVTLSPSELLTEVSK